MTISTKQICDNYREGVCKLCQRNIALAQDEDPNEATCIACFLGLRDDERRLLNRDDFALGLMCAEPDTDTVRIEVFVDDEDVLFCPLHENLDNTCRASECLPNACPATVRGSYSLQSPSWCPLRNGEVHIVSARV